MISDRHNRAKEIFLRAAELSSDRREAYVRDACGGDSELRADVEGLLREDVAPVEVLRSNVLGEAMVVPVRESIPERIGGATRSSVRSVKAAWAPSTRPSRTTRVDMSR